MAMSGEDKCECSIKLRSLEGSSSHQGDAEETRRDKVSEGRIGTTRPDTHNSSTRALNVRLRTRMANPAAVHVVLVLFLSLGVSCSSMYSTGECFFNTKGSCEHEGQLFDMGQSWITSDCYQCFCMEPFGVGCCDLGSKPVDYPEWCEVIRKPDSCTNVAVMRANHKLPCLWGHGRLRTAAGHPWKPDNDLLF